MSAGRIYRRVGDGRVLVKVPQALLAFVKLRGALHDPVFQLVPGTAQTRVGAAAYPYRKPREQKGQHDGADQHTEHDGAEMAVGRQRLLLVDLSGHSEAQLLVPQPGAQHRHTSVIPIADRVLAGKAAYRLRRHAGQRQLSRVGDRSRSRPQVDTRIAHLDGEHASLLLSQQAHVA